MFWKRKYIDETLRGPHFPFASELLDDPGSCMWIPSWNPENSEFFHVCYQGEQREPNPYDIPLYWLVYRDPYNGLL